MCLNVAYKETLLERFFFKNYYYFLMEIYLQPQRFLK